MAYPFGDCDDRIARVLRAHTGVQYARTVRDNGAFHRQKRTLLQFDPTVHATDFDRIEELWAGILPVAERTRGDFLHLGPQLRIRCPWAGQPMEDFCRENWPGGTISFTEPMRRSCWGNKGITKNPYPTNRVRIFALSRRLFFPQYRFIGTASCPAGREDCFPFP